VYSYNHLAADRRRLGYNRNRLEILLKRKEALFVLEHYDALPCRLQGNGAMLGESQRICFLPLLRLRRIIEQAKEE